MVVGAFPIAKLGTLLLRQISKPLSNVIKERAKSSSGFRKYICMPPAQFYNWCEVKAKMWILNLGKPVNIPVLNEAMAIELGSNLLGETIIFVVAASILINEYYRSVRKETVKEEAKRIEMEEIRSSLAELFIQCEENAAHIRELTRKMGELDTRIGTNGENSKPTTPDSLPSDKIPSELPSLHPSELPSDNPPGSLPSTETSSQSMIRHSDPTLFSRANNPSHSTSLVLKAVRDVEHQFWNYPLIERQNSVLILGLFYINKLFKFQE